MLSQNSSFQTEEKEYIIGFDVLSDGAFLKIHHDQRVEIQRGTPDGTIRQFIELKNDLFDSFDQIIYLHKAELPNQRLFLAYKLYDLENPRNDINFLAMLDLKNGTCLTTLTPKIGRDNLIITLYPISDDSLLINSKFVVTYEEGQLKTQEDLRFIDFRNKFGDWTGTFIPLLDQSGFFYYDKRHQSTLKRITNQFEEKGQRQLGPAFNANNIPFLTPCNHSEIMLFQPLNENYVACVTQCADKYLATSRNRSTYRLHILSTDFSASHEKIFKNTYPYSLKVIDDQFVAVFGVHFNDTSQLLIKVFDMKCQLVKKLSINKEIACFLKVTPEGQLVNCSRTGEITVYHLLPESLKSSKLKEATEAVLKDRILPKVLLPMITDYAGFFNKQSAMPKGGYEEVSYPDEHWFSIFRLKESKKEIRVLKDVPFLEKQSHTEEDVKLSKSFKGA